MSEKKVKTYPWGTPVTKQVFKHEDIVEYYEKEVVKKIGEKDDDFIIKKVPTEFNRCDRQDFIDSHHNDVGVKNMIQKAVRNGEPVDYVMSDKFKSTQKGFVDSIAIEDALQDPDGFAKKTIDSYKKVSKLTGKKNAKEVSEMSDSQLRDLIDSSVKQYFEQKNKKTNVEQVEGEKKL